ncbi:MAG: PAS domain S-box protein [Kiritimatiellia bacterium]|jgi:PAS domain S-box-containing protein|nr:PAS domain S-box protein [Kiritimatiellia bacterium]
MNVETKAEILENAPVIIAVHDVEHRMLWANAAYREATGLSLKEIEGKKCYSVWGLTGICSNCPVTTALETGERAEAELTPQNQDHWPETQGSWLAKAAPVRDEDGRVIGAVEVAYNITDRKQAETQIRRLNEELEERVQQRTAELQDADQELRASNQQLEASNQQFEASNQQFEASNQQLMAATQQLRASNQQLEAANRQVKASEARFKGMFESRMVGILFWDAEGIITDANDKFLKIVGYTRNEILSGAVRWKDMTPPEYREQDDRALAEIAATGAMMPIEKEYIRKDGSHVPILLGAASLPGPELNGVAFVMDVTARKQVEQERLQLEVQLRKSQKLESIGTLAGGVAHEINNPINGVMNYAQLIIDNTDDTDGRIPELAGEIVIETERVAVIVRNLLQFARQNDQRHQSPARMADITEATLSLIRTVMRHDQILLQVDVPEDLPTIRCRNQQIQQVLMNLMTNARDALNERYSGHDDGKIMSVVAREIQEDGIRWIRTTVEDHGTGISEEVCDRLFEPFFTTKPDKSGTGLGLSISYGIVEDHGGRLTVESEVDKYTRFHMDLPVGEKT